MVIGDGEEPKKVDKIPKGYVPAYVDPKYGQVHKMDVTLPPAKSIGDGVIPNNDVNSPSAKQYQDWLRGQVTNGVHPDELIKQGYTTKENADKLLPFYKQQLVYTGEQTTPELKTQLENKLPFDKNNPTDVKYQEWLKGQQSKAEVTPATSNISTFKKLPIDYVGAPYDTYEQPDLNGQANKSIIHRVDRATGKIVDLDKFVKNPKDYNSALTEKTLQNLRDESVRGTGNQTMLPNNPNSQTIINKIPTVTAPTTTINAGQGFKKGGLVAKIKGYDGGGIIPDINTGTQVNASPSMYGGMSQNYQQTNMSGDPNNFNSSLASSMTNKGNDTYSNKFNMPKFSVQTSQSTAPTTNAYMQAQGYGDFAKQQQQANSANNAVNSGISQIPVIGSAIGAGTALEGVGKSALKYDANGNPVGSNDLSTGYNRSLNTAFTPAHEQGIDDFSKGNVGYGIADIASGGMAKTSASMVGTALGNNNWLGNVSNNYANSTNNPTIKSTTKLNPKTGLYENVGSTLTQPDKGFKKGGLVQMCAEGGLIKGKGTSKSDSINAEIKGNSFVVPSENVSEAKQIKKEILGKNPNEIANLKQGGGTPVKLSDTEMLFTPKEVLELTRAGIDLDKLAPHAEKAMNTYMKSKGGVIGMCAKGGLTPDKAAKMLHEGIANGHKITDQQRKYFGWKSHQK